MIKSRFAKREFRSLLIENVDVWTTESVIKNARVWVENGRFRGINATPTGKVERIDGGGKVLMPAGVDAQAHLRVPGQGHKETPATGLLAALKGGYSAILTMPNTQPTIDSVEVLKRGQEEVRPFESDFGVHVFWSAAITKKLNSDDLTSYEDLVRAGVRAFTNDGLGVTNDKVMEQAFAQLEKLGVPLLQHAEFLGHGGSLAPGPVQEKLGASPYPDEPEWKMVERDLRELRKHPRARYHVLHVSSRKTLELVRQAKREGLLVTAEVSPHHLFFNTETIDGDNLAFKMNPPIRSPEDQKALWQGLQEGVVDFVATDHAPHESVMKIGSFDKAAFGTLGLETTMNVLIFGHRRGWLNERRLVEVFASKPAEFLRLPGGFGTFTLDAPFHAAWVDVNAPEQVYTEDSISSLSKNSCFIGSKLPGRIEGAFHEQSVFVFP
ncbi:MAG: dihydroorotase [Bdellovibrionales bacterium]|nr:dihydroorotase [Bdellovibrionales bacterium]